MEVAIKIACLLGAFIGMEFVAWFTHKYIMHGFLWSLHKSHHEPNESFFEWNDFFFLFFGSIGASLIIFGLPEFDWRFFLGLGVSLYGLTYITIHDIFIHRRLNIFKHSEHWYFKGLRKAHYSHHKILTKEDGVAFGLLWVDSKFFAKYRKKRIKNKT